MKQEFIIEGMKCEGCANTVKERFGSLEGVESVLTDVASKKVAIISQSALDKDVVSASLAGTKYSIVE